MAPGSYGLDRAADDGICRPNNQASHRRLGSRGCMLRSIVTHNRRKASVAAVRCRRPLQAGLAAVADFT